MDRSAVRPVILGMLWLEPRSGYAIKAAVDRTTRFFWAASYGQIYPELRRLEEERLVTGQDRPAGGRRRRIYRLTAAGERVLLDWLRGGPPLVELRDESLLRLFFSDALPPGEASALLEDRRRGHEQYLEVLRGLAARGGGPDAPSVELTLRWGIDFNEWGARWCEDQLKRIRAAEPAA